MAKDGKSIYNGLCVCCCLSISLPVFDQRFSFSDYFESSSENILIDIWPGTLMNFTVVCGEQTRWPLTETYHVVYGYGVLCWFMVNRQDHWPKPTTLCTFTVFCVEQRERRDAAAIEDGAGLFPAGSVHAADRRDAECQGHSQQAGHWP